MEDFLYSASSYAPHGPAPWGAFVLGKGMTMIQYQSFAPDGFGVDSAYPRLVELDAALAPLRLVGDDIEVPLVTGESRRHVNLDYAASTPPLVEVWETVQRLLP